MILSLFVGLVALHNPLDFYSFGPYDSAVPRPESILHFAPGERHSTFRDQEQVVMAIASAAKNRVKVFQYGVTAEGRPLRVFAVGSPKNIARLDEIKAQHEAIAHGKGDPKATVPIVWINECIHGDETASFESGMWTLYNLAAARGGPVAKALENEVVIFNPVYNPDGHERYVVFYNSIGVGSSDPNAYENFEPSFIYGRLNHFRFDMNRDRVAFSQDETRAEFAEMLRWNPQVYIDQHGQVASYFFPPEPMSINVNVDRARNNKWTDIFGRATGQAFDSHGMSYFVKEEFDLYYPGYIDASNTLSGAIGMTHETDGGRLLASKREDGSVVTLRQGMEKHFVSALAVVETAAAHGQDLLADYATFKRKTCSGESAGKFRRVVMTASDDRPLLRMQKQLGYAGIVSEVISKSFSQADAHDYWTGKVGPINTNGPGSVLSDDRTGKTKSIKTNHPVLVVDIAQPQGALAKALLEPGSDFEPKFVQEQMAKHSAVPSGEKYPGPEEGEFYDFTGWALPYAHDLHAWWCESAPPIPVEDLNFLMFAGGDSSIGYILPYTDQDDILAACDAMAKGVRAMVTTKPMNLDNVSYPPGSFLFLAGRNDDGYEKVLRRVEQSRGVQFRGLTSSYPSEGRSSPGSESVMTLQKPSIAVVMGNGINMAQSGAIWFLMERVFKLPFTPIGTSALNNGDLSGYTCIVLPSGTSLPHTDRVREWLNRGNVAVAMGDIGWATSSGYAELPEQKAEMQSLPGSLFKAELDPRSFLSFGYERPTSGPITLAVPLEGDHFYTKKAEGGSIVTLSSDEKAQKLLSGWEWPDDTEKNLRGALFLQDVPQGRGHLVLFTQDPTARAMWPGLYKLLLNAMIVGSAR